MSNPFENSDAQPPKPTSENSPVGEPLRRDAGITGGPVIETPPSSETLTDEEVMRTLSVPVPYTPEEMAAAKERLNNDYLEPEVSPLHSDEQGEREHEALENVRKVVELMDEFELKYPLQELHAITHISLAELVEHPVRKPANAALVHIRKAMALVKSVPEIDERYLRLSRAVGMYNAISKAVDHNRG